MNDDSTKILGELLKWTKVTSYKAVKATLEEALVKEDERLIYHLSDGTRTGVEISQATGINPARISILQSSWTKLGLLFKGTKAYEKQFLLEDFGLPIPDAEQIKASKATKRKTGG
jgi:hypothetical protein